MTKNEILKRIDELETKKFYLAMEDHWTARDFAKNDEYFNEIQKLKAML